MNNTTRQSLEELAQHYSWDGQLKQLLLSLPRHAVDEYILAVTAYDKEGWRYILPELPSNASVLCLDTRFGATAAAFAEAGSTVTVIHPCPTIVRIMQYRLASLNLRNVTVMHVAPERATLPFADNHFDAIIHHDVDGTLTTNDATASSPFAMLTTSLLEESFRLLKPDGFVYFGVKNRYGYRELKKIIRPSVGNNKSPTHKLISMRSAKHLIERAGFRKLNRYPYLVEHGRVCEIISAGGYRSNKNSVAANEKLKQIILGKWGARFLAPAYGLICAKNHLRPCFIKGFSENLVNQNILARPPENDSCFKRYVPLHGKLFVTFGKAVGGNENVIIVIPKIPKITSWRRKEIAIVHEARALSSLLASKLPRLYVESTYRGETYFALSEIPGITIDRPIPQLDRYTHHAVEFLIQFNRITAHKVTLRDDIYSNLISVLINQVTDTYPSTVEIMTRIERRLHALVSGESVISVWFHGDYKLENLIFNQNRFEIVGIIDWEQSRRIGLPWLDLLYLIAYNRIMTENLDFFGVYRQVIVGEHFTDQEKSIMETYASVFPRSPNLKEALSCLFFIHHIGCRYKYNISTEGDRHNIFSALAEMEKRLALLAQ